MKDTIRKMCPDSLHALYARTKFWLRFKIYPQGIANDLHRKLVGYDINWKNPQTLNEKINWMKFYYDTKEWTLLADKYLVRDYVKERIGEQILPKIYGVWKRAEDIDFEKLPSKFVLKTNHGCKMVIPVLEKSCLDIPSVCKTLNGWLKTKYGYETIEPHYMRIKPLIYAEEFLENDTDFSTSLVDYKVFCLSGKPFCVMVCIDRIIGGKVNFSFFDCKWKQISNALSSSHASEQRDIPRPNCLPQLLEYATALAKGHPQVRVDFYIVHDKIYFGEMTFTSQGGYMDYISRDYCCKMGGLVSIV